MPAPLDPMRILTRRDVQRVIAHLHSKIRTRHRDNARMNLLVFRLSSCLGLRASELCGLRHSDVHLNGDRPRLTLPAEICKNKLARNVPLWWDQETYSDLLTLCMWSQGRSEFVVHAVREGHTGKPLTRRHVRRRFVDLTTRVLGRTHTIHDGRHTFISTALDAGHSLAEVMSAVGHRNLSTISRYTHIAVEHNEFGSMFTPQAADVAAAQSA